MIFLFFAFVRITGYNDYITIPGYPEIPVLRFYTQDTAGLDIKIEYAESLLKVPIYPHQPSRRKDLPPPPFYMKKSVYATDKFIPENLYKVKKLGYRNGKPLFLVEVHTHRYNPAKSILRYPRDIHIKGVKGVKRKSIYSVLFVGREEYLKKINDLIVYRLLQGYKTDTFVVNTTDTSIIRQGIMGRNPDAVVLVGDVDAIPTFTDTLSGCYGDLYYACDSLSSSLFIPNRIYGRLSGDTTTIVDVMDKVFQYETSNGYKNRCYFISSTDFSYHAIPESTHAYAMRVLRARGYVCDSLWGYYSSGTPIDEAFTDGRGLIVYSGHGYSGGWAGPSFTIGDVYDLPENRKPAMVWSFACQTGQFRYSECFTEALTRAKDRAGAIAFGATNYTYWDEDDSLERHMADVYIPEWTIGEIIDTSKLILLKDFADDTTMMRYYFFAYNIIGDPLLKVHSGKERQVAYSEPPAYFPVTCTLLLTTEENSIPVPFYAGFYQGGTPVFDSTTNGSLFVDFSGFDTGYVYYYMGADSTLPKFGKFVLIPGGVFLKEDSSWVEEDTLILSAIHNYGDVDADTITILMHSLSSGFTPVPETMVVYNIEEFSLDTIVYSYIHAPPFPSNVEMEMVFRIGTDEWRDTVTLKLPVAEFQVKRERDIVTQNRYNYLEFEIENIGNKTAYNVNTRFDGDDGLYMIGGNYKFSTIPPGHKERVWLAVIPQSIEEHYIDVSITSSTVNYNERFIYLTGIPDTLAIYRLMSNITTGSIMLEREGKGSPVSVQLEYRDIAGRLVRSVTYVSKGNIVDTPLLTQGIYFLSWSIQGYRWTEKVIITGR